MKENPVESLDNNLSSLPQDKLSSKPILTEPPLEISSPIPSSSFLPRRTYTYQKPDNIHSNPIPNTRPPLQGPKPDIGLKTQIISPSTDSSNFINSQKSLNPSLIGFRPLFNIKDLNPIIENALNQKEKVKIIHPLSNHVAYCKFIYPQPIYKVTIRLLKLYKSLNPQFDYDPLTHNPKRVLTRPAKGIQNDGYDNKDHDYILYVNDVIGTQEGKQ